RQQLGDVGRVLAELGDQLLDDVQVRPGRRHRVGILPPGRRWKGPGPRSNIAAPATQHPLLRLCTHATEDSMRTRLLPATAALLAILTAAARLDAAWIETAQLSDSGGAAGDEFSWRVAIDGDTAVVVKPNPGAKSGYASVFVRAAGVWSETARVVPSFGPPGSSMRWPSRATRSSSGGSAERS